MIIKVLVTDVNYCDLISVFNLPASKLVGVFGLSKSNNIAIKIINIFEGVIISKLSGLLSDNKIYLSIDSIEAKDCGSDVVALDIKISKVNIMSVIEALYPLFDRIMADKPKTAKLGIFISKKEDLIFNCLKNLFSELSEYECEELLCDIVNAFDEELTELLEKLASDNKMKITIKRLLAE